MPACGAVAALRSVTEQDEVGRVGTVCVSSLVSAGSLPLREVSTCVCVGRERERTQLRSQTNRAINLVNTSAARESFLGPLVLHYRGEYSLLVGFTHRSAFLLASF